MVVEAEGLVKNREIVNKIGMYAMGIAEMELGKPIYVAVESYKFARLFPLNHLDLTEMGPESRLRFVDTAIW